MLTTQNLRVGCFESEDGIQAGAALLDKGEVNGSDVGDRLYCCLGVAIFQWNGRLAHDAQQLREAGAQIGVLSAALPEIPTGVHGEGLEVSEPNLVRGDRGGRQGFELRKVNALRTL